MLSADTTATPADAARLGAQAPSPARVSGWIAVLSLAVGSFATVTTEFLPIGVLPLVAASLGVTEGTAGLMVTMPGIVAALAGPLLIVASGRLDRRAVLLVLSALLVVSNLLAAVAPDLTTMLVARLLLGLCVGGFWTFAPGATAHLVPADAQPRAMSYVLAGVSLATVAGVPAGALLANLVGWRASFGVAAGLSAVMFIAQMRLLPPMPPAHATRARDLLKPFTTPRARAALLTTLFLIAGHFAAYTYLTPLLQQRYGLSPAVVTTLLLVYGAAGFFGTFVGGRLASRNVLAVALLAALLVAGVLLFAATVGGGVVAGALVALVWGSAFGLIPVAMTTWMQTSLPRDADAGQAVLVTGFQVAIASGAFLGGVVVDHQGIPSAMGVAGGLALVAAVIVAAAFRPKAG